MPPPEQPDGPASELRPLLDAVLGAAADLTPGATAERGLRTRVEALCSAARSRGLAVEQVLVLLKDAWWRRTEARAAPRSSASDGLASLVTLCIHEFYREPPRESARDRADDPQAGPAPPAPTRAPGGTGRREELQ